MKKIIAMLMVLSIILGLCACGAAEEDPNAGIYYGTYGTYAGFSMPVEDLFDGGECSLELKSGGKGKIVLGGDSFNMKWTLEGENITIAIQGEESVGTLIDGVIEIEFMGMGLGLTFVKGEAEAS